MPMPDSSNLGKRGEEIAMQYLSQNGYILHHLNWRSSHREIDIVAERLGEIVFVEVKTRSIESDNYRNALSAVDKHKQKLLILAARHYMKYYYPQQQRPYRFDIITIVGNTLKHYKRAFSESDFDFSLTTWGEQEW